METRAVLLSVSMSKIRESAEKINSILHEYAQYILGRMGVPYQKRGISVISIIIDAPQPVISALSGKLGKLGCQYKGTVFQCDGEYRWIMFLF